jgi:hypothetical protein
LPRGVLVRGKVTESGSGAPVPGVSIQYIPEKSLQTQPANQICDEVGEFEMAVPAGSGWLVAHAQAGSYVLQELGSSQINLGKPGGQRFYAHAFSQIRPNTNDRTFDVVLQLQPGGVLTGRIVDESGKQVEEALVISKLKTLASTLWWRGHSVPVLGGRFELSGMQNGVDYAIHFLDAQRRLGATAILNASAAEPTVVLQPCGSAVMKFVTSNGEPVADHMPTVEMVVTPGCYRFDAKSMQAGTLAADSDFLANIDRMNHGQPLKSDALGKVTLHALIPGATYRVIIRHHIAKEFQLKAGETMDLGELTVEASEVNGLE